MSASLAAGTAPVGAVHALGLKFLAMNSKFQRFDEASRKHCHHPKSAKYIEADRRCRKYDAARWKAFEGAMTSRVRTPADALVQAVHAFDRLHAAWQGMPESIDDVLSNPLDSDEDPGFWLALEIKSAIGRRADVGNAVRALASLIAFLEPLAGLKADAFGWSDMPEVRARVLAEMDPEARP